jgi:hypothetical protein
MKFHLILSHLGLKSFASRNYHSSLLSKTAAMQIRAVTAKFLKWMGNFKKHEMFKISKLYYFFCLKSTLLFLPQFALQMLGLLYIQNLVTTNLSLKFTQSG